MVRKIAPSEDVTHQLVGDLGLDQLFKVVKVCLADRFAENLTYLGSQRVALFVGCERLAVFRLEGYYTFARSDARNFSTVAERT